MEAFFIFAWVYCAMFATSFWEAYVEGKNAWDKKKLGWKLRYKHYVILTAYHFWLFIIAYPLLVFFPMLFVGPDIATFGMILSAYVTGLIVEDFFWFIANPVFKFRDWNSKKVKWYPWVKVGRVEIPLYYVLGILIAILSWHFLWR